MEGKQDNKYTVSRRTFLKLAGIAGAAGVAVAFPEVLERVVYKAVAKGSTLGITTPGETDNVVSSLLDVSERISNSENPNFRPMPEIIGEATTSYFNKTGKKAFYKRSPSFRDQAYYAEAMENIAEASLLPTLPNDAIHQLASKFPSDAFYAYASSDFRYGQFADLVSEGSGFNYRFRLKHPEIFGNDSRIKNYDTYFSATEVDMRREIKEAREYVENIRKSTNEPVSASVVLEYFLEKNTGDLAFSIHDTASFIKFMTRNNPETG